MQAIGLTLAGQGGMLLLGTLAGMLGARLLGPEGRGQLAAAVIAAGVAQLLSELGLRAAVIRMVAAGRMSWKEGLATMTVLYGLVCLLTLPGAMLAIHWFHARYFPGIPVHILQIALIGIPIGLLEGSLTCLLIGHQRMPEVSWIWAVEKAGILLGLVTLVWLVSAGVLGAVVAQMLGTLTGIVLGLVLLARLPGGPFRVRTDLAADLVRFGFVWYGRNLSTSLNYRLDALLVFYFQGGYAAGLYAVAVSVAELLQFLPNAIDAVLFPDVSRGAKEAVEERTARLSRFTVLIALAGGTLFAVIGYPLLYLMFGKAFTAGYPALLLLLPGMVVLGQSKVTFSELLGKGYARYPALASWVALGATVVLDVLLIPRLGIAGAAIASTIAYTISAVIGLSYYRRITGLGFRALYGIRSEEVIGIILMARDIVRRRLHGRQPEDGAG